MVGIGAVLDWGAVISWYVDAIPCPPHDLVMGRFCNRSEVECMCRLAVLDEVNVGCFFVNKGTHARIVDDSIVSREH